jgi:hypothetical protein
MGATDLAARHENRRRAKADGGQNGQQIHREKQLSGAEQALTDSSNSDREKNGGQGRRAADGTGAREHPQREKRRRLEIGAGAVSCADREANRRTIKKLGTGRRTHLGDRARPGSRTCARILPMAGAPNCEHENRIKIGVDQKPSSDTGKPNQNRRRSKTK